MQIIFRRRYGDSMKVSLYFTERNLYLPGPNELGTATDPDAEAEADEIF